MNEIQKIHAMRETLEEAAFLILRCDTFIRLTYSGTPHREEILKEIEGFKKHMEKVFRPDVINP